MKEWEQIWHLRMPENFFLWCVHDNCWCCCHCPYMARSIKVTNFQQYVECHFLTFVQSLISESTITRLDLIWDSYPDQSLKRLTQEKRGCGAKVQGSTPIPGDRLEHFWNHQKIRVKKWLTIWLRFPIIIIYSTKDDQVKSFQPLSSLSLCLVIK